MPISVPRKGNSSSAQGAQTPPKSVAPAGKTPTKRPVRPAAAPAARPSRPVPKKNARPAEDEKYGYDEVTGKRYEKLPKSEFIGSGAKRRPVLQVDMDLDNLNGEANRFLAHLRVPPNKDEMLRLRAERVKRAREQRAQFEEEQRELNEKYGDTSAVEDPDEVLAREKKRKSRKKM